MDGMPYFRWWFLVLLTKWSCSINTVIIIDAAVREDKVASSCPSNWLKDGSLSPIPTDKTRRRPFGAGGEGRRFRDLLEAWTEGAAPGAGVNGVDSGSVCWADETDAAAAVAFAAWCAAALARELPLAAGP